MAESEQDAYQKLIAATTGERGKIDPNTMYAFGDYVNDGEDANTLALPMLALIRRSGLEKIKQHATILSVTDNIVALTATPAQLLELIQMDEVLSFEASGEGGTFEE